MNKEFNLHLTMIRLVLVVAVLAIGAGGYFGLSKMRKPPAKRKPQELVIRSNAVAVRPETAKTTLDGYGTVMALYHVVINAEVGGRIVEIHDKIEVGDVVTSGDLLFQIDPETYKLNVLTAQAEVERLKSELTRIDQTEINIGNQLVVVNKSHALAKRDFERLKKLATVSRAESVQRMEITELAMYRQENECVALQSQLALMPTQRAQSKANLSRAEVQLDNARLQLKRTRVLAPFTGRVVKKNVDAGQHVSMNQQLLELADDSQLELMVPIEGREVVRWLEFKANDNGPGYGRPVDKPVKVNWTESPDLCVQNARIKRIEKYDMETRTFNIAIEIQPTHNGNLSLVEGMFCKVEIQGRDIENVFRIPRPAVSYDGKVHLVVDGRLQTRQVRVAKFEGDYAIVDEGLAEGDIVLTSPLVKVLDGSKVRINLQDEELKSEPPENQTSEAGDAL